MTERETREKVIRAIECRLDISGSKYKHCLTCDYRHDIDHCQWACQTDGILEDALALLKAQEPVEPVRKPEIFDSLYFCGKCSAKVGFQMRKDDSWRFKCKFCPECGRKVEWE